MSVLDDVRDILFNRLITANIGRTLRFTQKIAGTESLIDVQAEIVAETFHEFTVKVRTPNHEHQYTVVKEGTDYEIL